MKNKFKIIGIILIGCLLFATGCSKDEEVNKIINAMSEIKNGRFDLVLSLGMKTTEVDMNMEMNVATEFNQEIVHVNVATEILGESYTAESYALIGEDAITTYLLSNDKWSKNESEFSQELLDSTNYSIFLNDYQSVSAITNEELASGTKGYKIKVSKEVAKAILNSSGEAVIEQMVDITNDLVIKVYVNEDYQIEKMIFDFNDIFTSKEAENEITNLIMTLTYKDFGKVETIIIPDAALKAK